MPRLGLFAVFCLLGYSNCSRHIPGPTAQVKEPAPQATPPELVTFTGMCDASGALPIDKDHFIVANDEDNVLRIYNGLQGGAPIGQIDLSEQLHNPQSFTPHKKGSRRLPRKPRPPKEADIEAAARINDHAYFLASHSKTGGPRSVRERLLLFATTLPSIDAPATLVGVPYRSLLDDLAASPMLAFLDLEKATTTSTPDELALNAEAMTSTVDSKLWVGLRSPLHEGRALLLRIANPTELPFQHRSRIDRVELLDLGGLGARALTRYRDGFLIGAGPAAKGRATKVYSWSPGTSPVSIELKLPDEFNIEGFFDPTDSGSVMLLSDDGNRVISGRECKKLPESAERRFRGHWVQADRLSRNDSDAI